ncbi:hypothetical protein CLOM_g12820 [Closterium sp. NIES-68]|nr:hypothetical protein CLOM_g12820 [Closterium sp. NIES-68]
MISNCSAASAAAADLGYCTSGAPLDAASATASRQASCWCTSAAAAGSAPAAVPSTGAPATRSAPRIAYQSPYGDWEGEKQQQSKVRFQGLIAYDADLQGTLRCFRTSRLRRTRVGDWRYMLQRDLEAES